MNTQRRILLVSVAVNLGLVALSAYALLRPPESRVAASETRAHASSFPAPSAPIPEVSTADLAGELARLRGLGLSLQETMPIVLDLLKRRLAAAAPPLSDRYWESDWQSVSREAQVARSQQTDAIRTALVSIYGADAESAAPFRDLFRPLDATLPFLSPAEQRAIAQFRLMRPVHMAAGPMGSGMVAAGPMVIAAGNLSAANGAALPGSHADFIASLPATLSQASAFEFALRDSPLAARIRAAHADLTEAEFRALFTAMADSERNRTPLPLDLEGSKVPRSKVLKVIAAGDPAWPGLRAAAARNSLPEQQVWAVYEVIRQTSSALAALSSPSGTVMPDRAQRAGAILQERQRRIEQLVGPKDAAVLLEALNETYRTLALRGPPPALPGMPVR